MKWRFQMIPKQKKRKHNYPKTRKSRRDSKNSMTYKILQQVGKDNLFEIWKTRGHISTAKLLSEQLDMYVSIMVIQYIAQRKFGWKRVVTDKTLPMYKAVLNGKVDPKKYKTIIFQ